MKAFGLSCSRRAIRRSALAFGGADEHENHLSPCFGMIGITLAAGCQRPTMPPRPADKLDLPFHSALSEEHYKNRPKAPQLIQGNPVILGRVAAVMSEQIKVDIGEVQPRYLPLKTAMEKNFLIHPGDDLVLVLNEQHVVVDYHTLGDPMVGHRIVRGTIVQKLPVGHQYAVVQA